MYIIIQRRSYAPASVRIHEVLLKPLLFSKHKKDVEVRCDSAHRPPTPDSAQHMQVYLYSKTCVKRPLSKRPRIGFQDQLSFNASQKNCRMLQWEHSAILSTFIKLPFVIKIFVLSIFEWPFYTGSTVYNWHKVNHMVHPLTEIDRSLVPK